MQTIETTPNQHVHTIDANLSDGRVFGGKTVQGGALEFTCFTCGIEGEVLVSADYIREHIQWYERN